MKKCWKQVLLLVMVTVAVICIGRTETKAATIVEEGSCGENATYTLDRDGVLMISGSGKIKQWAFAGRNDVKAVKINGKITEIGCDSFAYCHGLTSVSMPNGVISIKSFAFKDDSSLTGIKIPDTVDEIGEMAFFGCGSLTSMVIPNGIKKIGRQALGYDSVEVYDPVLDAYTTSWDDKVSDYIIYGSKGSVAESYAKENGFTFKENIGATESAKRTTKNTTIKLSKTSYTYSGKAKRPTVKVLTSDGKVIKASNYTVQYSNNVKVGRATAIIKFKGKYSGKIKATYTIKPKTTAIRTVAKKSNGVMVTWKKQSKQVSGYQIQYATDKKFTKDKKTVLVKGTSKTAKTITGLNKNKAYYIRIRTYKTVNGKKYYSSWSKAKSYNDNPFAESYKLILKQYPEDKKVVVKVNGKDVDLTDYTKYTLYDVDKDGTPELLIKKGDEIGIYTYDGQAAKKCGQIEDSFYSIYGNSENGIIVYGGGSGSLHMEYIDLYTLKNGRIYGPSTIMNTEEHSYEEIRNKVSSFTEITNFHRLSDTSLLDN